MTDFDKLTREEVLAALNDPDPRNPIAVELARLISEYGQKVIEGIRRGEKEFALVSGEEITPLKIVAMELVGEHLSAEYPDPDTLRSIYDPFRKAH